MCAKYKCRICYETFDFESDCVDHVKKEHPIESQPSRVCLLRKFRCSVCRRTFKSEEDCNEHRWENHREIPGDANCGTYWKCPECGVLFSDESACKYHLHSQNPETIERCNEIFKCNYCGETFEWEVDCREHLMKEHAVVEGYCEEAWVED